MGWIHHGTKHFVVSVMTGDHLCSWTLAQMDGAPVVAGNGARL